MADTVKVTPASKKIEFFDADSTPFQGKISLDSSDNLVLESPNDIYLGDSSATLSIATDMLFSASKKIAASANNVDITIGDTSSLTGNDIIIDSHSWSVTSGGAATFAGGILQFSLDGSTYAVIAESYSSATLNFSFFLRHACMTCYLHKQVVVPFV